MPLFNALRHPVRVAALALVSIPLVTAAFADTVVSTVKIWNPGAKQLTLRTGEIFPVDPAKIPMPESLKTGDKIQINYKSDDNGVTAIYSIVLAE